MDAEVSSSQSLDDSDINYMMIVAEESVDSSKKRKLRAEESELLPLPKHFCLKQQSCLPDSSCLSSDIESAECSYAMDDDTKISGQTSSSASITGSLYMIKDSTYSTGSSSQSSGYATSSVDQCCSKGNDKTQEYVEDFSHMEFISPEFADDDLQEVQNLVGSYVLSSAKWSVSNQDSEETTMKPTIDEEFEDYFSALMM